LTGFSRWVPDATGFSKGFADSFHPPLQEDRQHESLPQKSSPVLPSPSPVPHLFSRVALTRGSLISVSAPHPPSCAPFAPSPLRDFFATTGALTPAGHSPTMGQVSLIHVSDLPIPPSPTTPQALDVDFARYPSSRRVSCLRRSRLHHFPAGSPTLTGRIEFVILRMDRSPPAAPHPASRRRSCSRLQAGERIPEEDSHLSDQTRFQAHWNRTPRSGSHW
jgi:hypothetical protein